MKKIIVSIIISVFFFQITFASENQDYITGYENKIERNQKEIDELAEYEMRYGIVKDIEYFEKLLEKYDFIIKREEAVYSAFKYLKKCKLEGEICNYLTYNSNSISVGEINNLMSESSNLKWDYESKAEKLKENVDYLHKSQKEIEKREKIEGKKDKFEAEESKYVEKQEKDLKTKSETTKTNDKIIKEKNETNLKEVLTKRLDNILEKYSKKQKSNIYKILLKELEKLSKTEKINILIEILKEKR